MKKLVSRDIFYSPTEASDYWTGEGRAFDSSAHNEHIVIVYEQSLLLHFEILPSQSSF
jgi:hypothetical protein